MTTAMDEAEARYGCFARPSIWDRLVDLCLGKARAVRLHKARLEKAYWETIAVKRAAGVTIIEKYTEENFPGPRTGLEPPMEEDDDTADEDKPLFEPFFMDYDNFAFPAAHHLFHNHALDVTGPTPGPVIDFSKWESWDYGKRKRAIPRDSPESWCNTAIAKREIYTGYGFNTKCNPEVSGLAGIFGVPEHERWEDYDGAESYEEDGPQLAIEWIPQPENESNSETSVTSSSPSLQPSKTQEVPSSASTPEPAPVPAEEKGKGKAKDDDEDTDYDFDLYANDSGCALFSSSEGNNPVPKEFLLCH